MMRPTHSVDLRASKPTSVVLVDGTAATIRQPVPGHIVIQKGRWEIANASIVNGAAVNVWVHPDHTCSGVRELIVRSVKHSYGGVQQ